MPIQPASRAATPECLSELVPLYLTHSADGDPEHQCVDLMLLIMARVEGIGRKDGITLLRALDPQVAEVVEAELFG